MKYSAHNIFGKIDGSDSYYLINPLYKQADILEPEKAEVYKSGVALHDADFVKKQYVVDEAEEEATFRSAYLDFVDDRDSDEVQIFFVPWYDCNFNCSYCFQDEYTNPDRRCGTDVIDSFFDYVSVEFAGRKKYITLFGGEPLLPGKQAQETIEYFIEKTNKIGLDLAIVTNGYSLEKYVPILKKARIREIQVTLDGAQETHDKRRMHKNKQGTFEAISQGVSVLLESNIPVNLRMVVDKENLHDLAGLSQYAIDAGWTKSPYFKTQLGRNYELHHCQEYSSKLFGRLELYQEVYALIKQYPHIAEFYKPAFSISKFLFENGEMPAPLFDSCPGAKTEWAFDYTGAMYSCTATVGKTGEELGTFYPSKTKNEEAIEEWEERDVLSISSCKDCSVRLACGGGCAAVAKVQTGSIANADCRPIEGLLSLGVAHYFVNEL